MFFFLFKISKFFSFQKEFRKQNAQVRKNCEKTKKIFLFFFRFSGGTLSDEAIDLDDIREIIHRLSGKSFTDEQLTSIAQSVINEVDLRDEKKITNEIFEYFLSNVPDFPS